MTRVEVPDDLIAALEASPEAKVGFAALKGSERYSLLYRLHQVQVAEKRKAAVAKAIKRLVDRDVLRLVATDT